MDLSTLKKTLPPSPPLTSISITSDFPGCARNNLGKGKNNNTFNSFKIPVKSASWNVFYVHPAIILIVPDKENKI